MKKKFALLMAAGLSGAMMLSLATACGDKGKAAYYVGIDVNPSLSLVLDKNDTVICAIANNEDAQVLLYDENLEGMSAEEAAQRIAELSFELGYLNEDNHGVNITIEGKSERAAEKLENKIQKSFVASAGEGFALTFTSQGTFSANRELEALKAEYSANASIQELTLGKFELIVEAQRADNTLSVEVAAEMDVSELVNRLADAAETIEPYATAAYDAAKTAAARIYYDTKSQLLDSIWLAPYNADAVASLIPGYTRKYSINYGLVYNVYTASARTLNAALDVAEAAERKAEQTAVSDATLNAVADTLRLTDDEREAFFAEVAQNGKTVAVLDEYLNRYFKNMTEEELAAAKAEWNELMQEVQKEADRIDALIADEYKAALNKLAIDTKAIVSDLIPDRVKDTVGEYLTELETLIQEIESAVDGKEPKPATYATLEVFENRADEILGKMRTDLTEEDLQSVENAQAAIDKLLSAAEERFKTAIANAEQLAKDHLEALKAARTNQ